MPTLRTSWEDNKLEQELPERPPECSIKNIKPTITPFFTIPDKDKDKTLSYIQKKYPESLRRCCCCGDTPTMKASYSIEGAVVIQYYCDPCAERELPLH
jgi:hypothetical protein